MNQTRIGLILRKWRRQEDIGVREAAKTLGISAATLSRIENGHQMDAAIQLNLINWLFRTPEAPNG